MSGFRVGLKWSITVTLFVMCVGDVTAFDAPVPSPRLAVVNGQSVLQRDVDLELLLSGIQQPTPAARDTALERVIDRTLVAKFVATKGTDPLAEDVENLVQFVIKGIESGGDSVESVLGKLHLTEGDVRQAARISVSWKAYVGRTLTETEIREHFESNRAQFDGTKVRLRQIVRTIPPSGTPDEWKAAEKLLTDLQQQITTGKLEFGAAAATHSMAPSATEGGEVGLIGFRGDVPVILAGVAFSLQPGEISPPVHSPLGVHLLQVTERLPGELSLEDARPAVVDVLSEQLWDKTVKGLRGKAKIVKE